MDRPNFSESFVKSAANKLMARYTKDLRINNLQYNYMVDVGGMSKSACYGLLDELNRELNKSLVGYEVCATYTGTGLCYLELRMIIGKK